MTSNGHFTFGGSRSNTRPGPVVLLVKSLSFSAFDTYLAGVAVSVVSLTRPAMLISCNWRVRLSKHWGLTSTETVRLIRDGEKGGGGVMEEGGEGDYIPIATLSPPE